jgi:hypothetical protein
VTDTIETQTAERPTGTAGVATSEPAVRQGEGTAEIARQMGDGQGSGAGHADGGASEPPLFPPDEAENMQRQWQGVQASFVDEPRSAVQQADELVAGAIKRLAQTFADERAQLEGQWDRGDQVSTEDLRLALQKYRAFFGRLLKI